MSLCAGFVFSVTNPYVRLTTDSKIVLLTTSFWMDVSGGKGFPLISSSRNFSSHLRHATVILRMGLQKTFFRGVSVEENLLFYLNKFYFYKLASLCLEIFVRKRLHLIYIFIVIINIQWVLGKHQQIN